jgi:hypothetical protein
VSLPVEDLSYAGDDADAAEGGPLEDRVNLGQLLAGGAWDRDDRLARAAASMGPRTGMPSMREPILAGSSSRNATTLPKTLLARISAAIVVPVKPAPTM